MRILNKELFKSLRFRIGLVFFVIFLPLIVLMLYNSINAARVVHTQVAGSNKNLVSLYLGQIDHSLEEVDDYLLLMAARETDLVILDKPNTFETSSYQLARLRTVNKISSDISNYKQLDMFFVYSENNDDFLMGPNDTMTFDQRNDARNLLKVMIKGHSDVQSCIDKWCIRKIDQNYYLCHIARINDVYVGAWVDINRMMIPMNLIDLGTTGISVITTAGFEPTSHAEFIKEQGIDLELGQAQYKLTGSKEKFLEVGESSKKGDFMLMVLMPDKRVLENLPLIQRIVSFVSVGFFTMLVILLLILRMLILRPISRMLQAMRRFKEGNWDTQIPYYSSSGEFEVMNTTFNEMVSQIRRLKIDIYEEQLNNQRAELKHLQLQINPHFFLNSLNIVYHLAQAKKFELIQEMALSLVEYFRFMFRSNLTFVSLLDEIKHTRNYLNIQQMRFPKHLTFDIEVMDGLENTKVPPLIVQTFVENAIKHSVTTDNPVHIQVLVQVEAVDGSDRLRVLIQDTGKGFPDDVLLKLRSNQDLKNEKGENIGIWNVKRRLALLYENNEQITFWNTPRGGASVEIVLPLVSP